MKIFKSFAFYFVQLLFCGILLEVAAHFFLLGSKNPLYRARRVLQVDSTLGWKQKPNLNTQFENSALTTNAEGFRSSETAADAELLTLGPSSAFGWGISSEQTYTAIAGSNTHLKFFNGGQIGYSALQGRKLWNDVLKSRFPNLKVAVISYGINDLDKFRFYSDEPTSIEKIEKYSDFFTMLSLAFSEISYKYKCEDLVTIKQRLSLPDYLFEIAALVQDLRANGVIPVIVNTPYFLKQDRVQDPQTIAVEYAKVEQSARANDCQAAMEHLKIAKGLEPERVQRDVIVLNTALREFASANKLAYIDAYTALDSSKKEQNFVDPVHPSAVGHQLIARQLSDSVLQLLHGKK